jgi:hypothetical protein
MLSFFSYMLLKLSTPPVLLISNITCYVVLRSRVERSHSRICVIFDEKLERYLYLNMQYSSMGYSYSTYTNHYYGSPFVCTNSYLLLEQLDRVNFEVCVHEFTRIVRHEWITCINSCLGSAACRPVITSTAATDLYQLVSMKPLI